MTKTHKYFMIGLFLIIPILDCLDVILMRNPYVAAASIGLTTMLGLYAWGYFSSYFNIYKICHSTEDADKLNIAMHYKMIHELEKDKYMEAGERYILQIKEDNHGKTKKEGIRFY
jgi:hypothetical protein